jgi:predicted transcriptional regulator of viral defense system
MTILALKTLLKDYPVFSVNDIIKIEPGFHRQRLVEWQNKGYLKKIVDKYYIFSDTEINDELLYLISNRIYQPSYISLETALRYYNLIPENVYTVTAISSKRTYLFNSVVANFQYRKIKPVLIFGYKAIKYKNYTYKIAEIEKTLLDYFYLNSQLKTQEHFEEMRFNSSEFLENYSNEKLMKYLDMFTSKSLSKRINNFISFISNV